MRLFHRHRLQVQSVQHGVTQEGCAATCALLMCKCGHFDTVNVSGHWSVEDLSPKSTLADHKFLKELGVRV